MRRGRVQRRPREAGVALLLAVWVLALLAVIGGELIYSGKVRLQTELNRRDDLSALALALAGYHDALAALEQVTGLSREDDRLLLHFKGAAEGEAASREDVQLGGGKFSWRVEDEDGRMNINKMTRSQIVDLLQECGMEIGVERDTVADSILDWIDKDSLKKVNGAEEEYYNGLTPAYSSKDGNFDVVEELLLVNGIRDQEQQWVFYGKEDKGEKRPGLRDLVSTFAQNPQPNFATAPEGVLKAMKKARSTTPKTSNNFSIVATGSPGSGSQPRSLRAVVQRDTTSAPPFKLVYWNDAYIPE